MDDMITWDQTPVRVIKREITDEDDDDEEVFGIKKQFNAKVAVFYGKPDALQADLNVVISSLHTAEYLVSKLKDARQADQSTALLYVTDAGKKNEHIKALLSVVRRDISNKQWKKIVIAADDPRIYNSLLQEMCVFFPKIVQNQKTEFSDSDDSDCSSDDDDEFYLPNRVPDDIDDQDDASIPSDHSAESDIEDHHDDQQGYRLRRDGRRPPNRFNDYVMFTLVAQ